MLSFESVRARLAVAKDQPIAGLEVEWRVDYVRLDHDMRITFEVRAADGIDILQVWTSNLWIGGVTFPEDIPQITSIVEFADAAHVRAFKGALSDGKWRRQDKGQRYRAAVAGYCRIGDGLQDFFYSREYEFPGW